MILGQTPTPAEPVVEGTVTLPAWAVRLKTYAATAEQYIDAPIDDIASLISVDAVWLGSFLLGLKFLTSGLFLMRQAHCPVPRRR